GTGLLRPGTIGAGAVAVVVAKALTRVSVRPCNSQARLNFAEALVFAGTEPRGIRELNSRERDVVDRRFGAAVTLDERLEVGRLYIGCGHVFARARNVVQTMSGSVEIELARRV